MSGLASPGNLIERLKMRLYHYNNGRRAVYEVEPHVTLEEVFGSIKPWPGTKLVSIPGGLLSPMRSFDPCI